VNAANFGQLVERQVSGKLSNSTEVVEQHEVAPGLYLVVPCVWTPGVEMKFLLRIFTDTETNSRYAHGGWLGSRVVSVLDSGAEGPGFRSQPRRCRVTVLGKLFTPIFLCSQSSKIDSSPVKG